MQNFQILKRKNFINSTINNNIACLYILQLSIIYNFTLTKTLLFTDPLEWTSFHIKSWLKWSSKKFSLSPTPEVKKFPDSGTELCKLSRADFEKIAGNSRNGTLLAKHIAHLRHSVTGRASSPLNVNCKIEDDDDKGVYKNGCYINNFSINIYAKLQIRYYSTL